MVKNLAQSRTFWSSMFLFCLAMEAIALYYQYALNYLPCVLCIHVRMLLAAIMIVCVAGFVLANSKVAVFIPLVFFTGLWLWMTERSYQLLGVERGWLFGECDMSSGLPQWLALEKWFPALFEIHEPCGYTPFLLFGISMAEALIVFSVVISALGIASIAWLLFSSRRTD